MSCEIALVPAAPGDVSLPLDMTETRGGGGGRGSMHRPGGHDEACAAERWVGDPFVNRVLAFGGREARLYASLVVHMLRTGRHIDMPDAQIAAIALAHGASLATRNVIDFEGTGINLINPWDAAPS